MPTKPRARSLWLLAAGLPLVFVSGCPQLASDDFTKAPFDSEDSGASGGSDAEGAGGAGGTTPSLAFTVTSAGGSETAASTSQGGTDPGTGGSESTADAATSTTSETTTSESTTSDATTSETTTSETTTSETTTSDTTTDGGTTGGDTCIEETEICDGLDNDCDDEVDEEVCGRDSGCEGFAIGGHGYMFCGRPLSVDEALVECSSQGMNLVQINSAAENEALVAAADAHWNSEGGTGGTNDGGGTWGGTRSGGPGQEQQPAFWTGGSDENSESWIWTGSGTAFWEGGSDGMAIGDAYSNWGPGRPNEANDTPEDCAAVYFRQGEDGEIGTWNDLECGDGYPFICESP